MRSLQTDDEIKNSVYGMLTVIWRAGRDKHGVTTWLCWCECGHTCTSPLFPLRNGRTQSCGCVRRELIGNRTRKHGKTSTREYHIWCGMKARCGNPKNRVYPNYGGRGITVCDRWLNSFDNFIADVGYAPSEDYSIDRIDTNGNYEPGNVRWATDQEQANNTRTVTMLTAFGKTQSTTQWARETGIDRRLICQRIALGWTHERAVSEKVRGRIVTPKVDPNAPFTHPGQPHPCWIF